MLQQEMRRSFSVLSLVLSICVSPFSVSHAREHSDEIPVTSRLAHIAVGEFGVPIYAQISYYAGTSKLKVFMAQSPGDSFRRRKTSAD